MGAALRVEEEIVEPVRFADLGITVDELAEKLADRDWRLGHLYRVRDKNGRDVVFRMNPEQRDYYENLWFRNLILKARQLGFTTEQCIIQLDAAIFEDAQCALIAHTLPVAQRLFREKVQYAYERLPDAIKATNPLQKDKAGEMVFQRGGSVYVDVSFRGGTLTYLHVSEFGKICAKHPEKAREIVTGAFEAVPIDGVITIESTAEGQGGYFHDYAKEAMQLDATGKAITRLDWRFFFYPWWQNPAYTLDAEEVEGYEIPDRLHQYFDELTQKHGAPKLTPGQKAWYAKKEKDLGEDMKREYPSHAGEPFHVSVQGAYYHEQFMQIYRDGRICRVPHEPGIAVHTIWDLGVNDTNAIWFVQRCGREWHVIDYYANSNVGDDHYYAVLDEKRRELGYHYGKHVGPHDLKVREWGNGGKSRWQSAIDKGIRFEIAPGTAEGISRADGIAAVRRVLPLCWFDESRTEEGVGKLQRYRKEWDEKHGRWKDTPLHDDASNPADSFRYFAVSLHVLEEGYTTVPVAQETRRAARRAYYG